MVDKEHLAILKSGVEAWNKWRRESPKVRPNLEGADLIGANLIRVDLGYANLESANLESANLESANLRSAVLGHAVLRDAVLSRANLRDTNLRDAYLRGANLRYAKLIGTHLGDANLNRTNLSGAYLKYADLRSADLESADLSGANLSDADLSSANLRNADLSGADLSGADLSNARVTGVMYLPERRHNPAKGYKFIGSKVETCHGNLSFKRYVQDQTYLEEFFKAHPRYFHLWWITSLCGQSIGVWAIWAIILALIFGFAFAGYTAPAFLPDWMESILVTLGPDLTFNNPNPTGFTPYYFSIVTFTTLGFGDVTPNDLCGEIWVTLEVILGYVMLGGLISILANKLARRS